MFFVGILLLLTPLLTPTTSDTEKPLIFFDGYIKNEDHVWQFLTDHRTTAAWAIINYCDAQFLVNTCEPDGLNMDTLFQLSNTHNAFFMQLDMNSVQNAEHIVTMLYDNERDWNVFGVPAVDGPGATRNLGPTYDPMRPEFVQSHNILALMFNEGPRYPSGYSEANLIEMRLYVTQYLNAGRQVLVVFDAFYLTMTSPKISEDAFDMNTAAVVYRIPGQIAPDPFLLQACIKKLKKRTKVILFFDYEMMTRMKSYLPSVSWTHIPFPEQHTWKTYDTLRDYLHSGKQLVQLSVQKCEKHNTVMPKCDPNSFIAVDAFLQHLDFEKIILLHFSDIFYMLQINFQKFPGNTFLLLKLAEGPNAEKVTGAKIPDPAMEFIQPLLSVNFVLGFSEAEGTQMYTNKQVLQLMAEIPKSVLFTHLGIRLQMRIIAKMTEDDIRQAFRLMLYQKKIKYLFLYIVDMGEKTTMSDRDIAQLRENILVFNIETYLFADDEERENIYTDVDRPLLTWTPWGQGSGPVFTPTHYTWPAFIPMGTNGAGKLCVGSWLRWSFWYLMVICLCNN